MHYSTFLKIITPQARYILLSGCILWAWYAPAQSDPIRRTDFDQADSIAACYPGHSLINLKTLVEKLTRPLPTEVEKFRAIYLWICLNIDNDYAMAEKRMRMHKKHLSASAQAALDKSFNQKSFKRLKDDHKTICTGYAYLVHEMAILAGIPCEMINGYGRNSTSNVEGPPILNHTWNSVKLNGHWYLCDATWSSGFVNGSTKQFVKKYNDIYFLTNPTLFLQNHYPLDTTWMLVENKPTLQEFLNRPLAYSHALTYAVDHVYPMTFHITTAKKEPVAFQFQTNPHNPPENASLLIVSNTQTADMIPVLPHGAEGVYRVDYRFNHTSRYTAHLLINNEYTYTYRIQVK